MRPAHRTSVRGVLALALVLASSASSSGQTASATFTPAQPPGTMGAPSSARTGTGIVIGRVVDMTTGQAVVGAVVTVGSTAMVVSRTTFGGGPSVELSTPGALDGASRASDLRVLTDNQGRFAFLDLPKGSLQFGVTASGYLGGGYGMRRPGGAAQPLELTDGQRVTDLTLPVWRFGAISGMVADETGEPIVALPVTLLRWQIVAGRRLLVASGQNAATDDRGIYRIPLLIPGEYIVAVAVSQATKPLTTLQESIPASSVVPPSVAATLPGSPTALQVGNQILTLRNLIGPMPAATTRVLTYSTVFYPSARMPSEATVVNLAPGEERSNIDLQLRLTPTARVSGTVSGPNGPMPRATLRLVPAGLDDVASDAGFEVASTSSDASGAFLFGAVPPGRYLLRGTTATAPGGPVVRAAPGAEAVALNIPGAGGPGSTTNQTLFIDQPVAVADDDLTSLAVTMRTGARISASLQFDGLKERPAADSFRSISVTVAAADARTIGSASAPTLRAPFDATGRATTGNIGPGRYLLTASGAPAGWSFKAAMLEGRDVSSTPLEFGASDLTGVTIIFTDRTSELTGTVQMSSGAPDPDATVLLFPSDDRLWTDAGGSPRRMKTMRVTRTGGYTIATVPEGDYFIVAVRDDVLAPWPDPAFLASLRQFATRVSIADGDRKTMNLRTAK